jgi:hypothetical protein
MGSSASKASRAAGSAARQYPARTPAAAAQSIPSNPLPSAAPAAQRRGPTVKPPPQASTSRSDEIDIDASDPDFARSLRSLGPVQPMPTVSNTSTVAHPSNPNKPAQEIRAAGPNLRINPAITVLEARARLQDEAEREFMEAGRRGHDGRQFLDVFTIRQILTLRDERGRSSGEIEKTLGLKRGVVERLGMQGVVQLAQETGRARREIDMV